MSAVEQHARAHVVTDSTDYSTDSAAEEHTVPVALTYDPEADPPIVRMTLPASVGTVPGDWVFDRELLEKGLTAPAASGDIRIWPCGRVQAIVELHTASGVSLVQFDSQTLIRFLGRTYAATAAVTH
ncbi:SsgA family sporulation/cell division regulator [Streptomyces sp. NPDC058001]|uniref:SsgA family sporulation/cell division regulator n=1 Tax=Streptomyces sp. NPDC058001 TaxID=3346300 RepID=UPI0036F021FE